MDELGRALEAVVEGEVRFDAGSHALYAHDASNHREVPIGVVLPCHVEDVLATLRVCRAHAAPVLGRGGGTTSCAQIRHAASATT